MKKITKVLLTLAVTVFAVFVLTMTAKPEAGYAASKLSAPKITGVSSSSKTITVSWSSVKGADGYKIYKYNSSKKKYKECGSVDSTSPCFYEVTGLKSGKTYKFKVAAYVEKSGKKTVQTKSSVKKAKTLTVKNSSSEDFYVYDVNGNKVCYSDYLGKPVIVNIWATWCGPCIRELPGFDNLYKKYGDKVKFLISNCESESEKKDVISFVEENGYSFPIYLDLDFSVSETFYTGYVPITVAIKADGTISYFESGSLPESSLESIIKDLLD